MGNAWVNVTGDRLTALDALPVDTDEKGVCYDWTEQYDKHGALIFRGHVVQFPGGLTGEVGFLSSLSAFVILIAEDKCIQLDHNIAGSVEIVGHVGITSRNFIWTGEEKK